MNKGTRFVVQAVFSGTSLRLAVPGKSVDSIMSKLRKKKEVRNATCFLFYNRSTEKLADVRMN